MTKNLIYLAAPYSFAPKSKIWKQAKEKLPLLYRMYEKNVIMERRFKKINFAAGALMSEDVVIFSPISHSHPIKKAYDLPSNWEYWERIDRFYLSKCDMLLVLMIEGWERSTGVGSEINIAKELKIPVGYIGWERILKLAKENKK